MRLSKEKADFIRENLKKCIAGAEVYLFGSRVDDTEKGGDIDILIIGDRKLTLNEKIDVKISFYEKFGEQKIDIVSFKKDEESSFRELALEKAVEL